jgi:hypothetical protein
MPSSSSSGPRETLHSPRAIAALALSAFFAGASVYASYYLLQTFQLAQLATFLALAVLGLVIFTVVDTTIFKDFDTVAHGSRDTYRKSRLLAAMGARAVCFCIWPKTGSGA